MESKLSNVEEYAGKDEALATKCESSNKHNNSFLDNSFLEPFKKLL